MPARVEHVKQIQATIQQKIIAGDPNDNMNEKGGDDTSVHCTEEGPCGLGADLMECSVIEDRMICQVCAA